MYALAGMPDVKNEMENHTKENKTSGKNNGKIRRQHICNQALIAGQNTCKGEDLLTECINICKELKIKCVTQGEPDKEEILNIKRALWRENSNGQFRQKK